MSVSNSRYAPARVVLVPGLVCDAAAFEPQVRKLEELGWDCVVAGVNEGSTIDEMASLVLSTVEGRIHVVGLSMGGYVALAMARHDPRRVGSLTLIGTSARGDTDEQRDARQNLISLAQTGRFDEVVPRLMTVFLGGNAPQAVKEEVESMVRRVGPEVFSRQQWAIATRPDVRSTLSGIAAPALIICGADDPINPPEVSQEVAAVIPGGRLEVVPATGHLCNLEAPQPTNELIGAFLRTHAS